MKYTARTRFSLILTLVFIIASLMGLLARHSPVDAQDEPILLYGKFEVSFAIDTPIDNPYEPESADVIATFTAPSGRRVRIPAFYIEPYEQTCQNDCTAEVLEPAGDAEWRVRFTPDEVGRWQYNVTAAIDEGAPDGVARGSFVVTDSDAPGFIHTAPNSRYFEFDNAMPYFPIGENLQWSWADGGGIFAYIEWLNQLQAAGANYARVNIDVPWFIGLEWTQPAGQYGGLGQQAAWRLDTIIEEAQERGIYLQLILIWHRGFQDYQGSPVVVPSTPPRAPTNVDFDSNPYNSRLNGSLATPGGVFNDSVSMRLLERRFRYIVARWAYSPQIFAWEVVDSLDDMAGFAAQRDLAWLNSLIASLREVDPYDHLVTVGLHNYNNTIQTGADLDFTQARVYQNRPIESTGDQTTLTFESVAEARATGMRPTLLSEFSLNRWFEPSTDDVTGVHIQNTLWASVLAGAAGGAMPMWWDTYIDPQNLYSLLTPLRLFTDGVPWNSVDFALVEPGLVSETPIEYEPIRLDAFNRQFKSASMPDTIYHVTADGSAPPESLTSSYLYGRQFNSENSRPQTFIFSPPVDTQLLIRVENVSTAADAQLVVQIDGQTRTTLDLTAGTRGLTLNFPLSAGQHTVVLDNLGQDWLQLEYLEVEQYRAPLRAMALADRDQGIVLVWLHNRAYTWTTILADEAITPLEYQFNLPEMPVGNYRVEFWDPLTGMVIGEETVRVDEGQPLRVDLLPIKTQLALRIFRLDNENTPQAVDMAPTRTPAPTE